MLHENFMHVAKFCSIAVGMCKSECKQGLMCKNCYHALEIFILKTNKDVKQARVVSLK